MSTVLTLSSLPPLATGTLRRVYAHPREAGRLIKVIRPEIIERRWGAGAAWFKRFRRARQFIAVQREVEEYLAGQAKHGRRLPFVQQVFGFEETDLGLGFVTEALRGRDGEIAPTLRRLVESGRCDERVRAAFERFAREFEASDVVIGDFSAANIVLAWDETHGERFVLVDGLGCSTFIPFKAWCRPANRWSKRRQLARVRAELPAAPRAAHESSRATANAKAWWAPPLLRSLRPRRKLARRLAA